MCGQLDIWRTLASLLDQYEMFGRVPRNQLTNSLYSPKSKPNQKYRILFPCRIPLSWYRWLSLTFPSSPIKMVKFPGYHCSMELICWITISLRPIVLMSTDSWLFRFDDVRNLGETGRLRNRGETVRLRNLGETGRLRYKYQHWSTAQNAKITTNFFLFFLICGL